MNYPWLWTDRELPDH